MVKCVVPNCETRNEGSFFGFPVNDLQRCKHWLSVVGRVDLLKIHLEKLRNCKVCELHFNNIKTGLKRSTLPKDAVPCNLLPEPIFFDAETWPPHDRDATSGEKRKMICPMSSFPSKVVVIESMSGNCEEFLRQDVEECPTICHHKSKIVEVDVAQSMTFIFDDRNSFDMSHMVNYGDMTMTEIACNDTIINPDTEINSKELIPHQEELPPSEMEVETGSVSSSNQNNEEQDTGHCITTPTMEKVQQSGPSVSRRVARKQKCAVVNCDSENEKMHKFPSIVSAGRVMAQKLERCRQWIKNSGNLNLLNIPSSQLSTNHFICQKHFSNDQFTNMKKDRLRIDAIPSLHCPAVLLDEELHCYPVLDKGMAMFGDFNGNNCNFHEGNHDDGCQVDPNICKFENDMEGLQWYNCSNCKESFISKRRLRNSCLHNKSCSSFTDQNQMDPGPVPDELQGLSMIEEQLIARINPIVSVYQVKGHQYKYSGNVINFHQRVEEVATKLPRTLSDINSTMTVRAKKKECEETGEQSSISFVEFSVRADKVKKALSWLKENNKFYSDIEISSENLAALPDDGNVFSDLQEVNFPEVDEDNHVEYKETVNNVTCTNMSGSSVHEDIGDEFNESETESINDLETDHESYGKNDEIVELEDEEEPWVACDSGVPMTVLPSQDEQIAQVLDWPTIETEPLNEFKTPGYIAMAFPTLYPTGDADLNADREKTIPKTAYFQHMLRYEDGRFAKHPRFRYFALNTLMRWTAINDGNMFVNKNDELKNMTVRDLKEKLKENPNILRKVMFHCNNLKGTKPFWKARTSELINMIEQLGMPTFFLTLSAADLHWPDLFRLLSPDEDLCAMSEGKRRNLVAENPLVVDKFFSERVESFLQNVLIPKFKVVDYWYRVEYQHRGSPHIHGVFWLEDAPDVSNIQNATAAEKEIVVQYFDNIVCTLNPNPGASAAKVHPCRQKFHDVIQFENDLAELLNKVQSHTICSENYCLRKDKKTGETKCRFGFPKEKRPVSEIDIDEGDVKFVGKRDDSLLNNYNEYIIRSWRANMDISPVLSKRALISYLAKYVSKAESKSIQLKEVLSCILNKSNEDDKKAKSIIQKLYIQSCSERDYSAQEVMHLLLGEKLYSAGGRQFVKINFGSMNDWKMLETEDSRSNGKSTIEKYLDRPEKFSDKCLWDMAKNYHLPSGRRRTHNRAAIVQIFPNVEKLKICDPEEYCRIKVLLYVPWQSISDFRADENSWKQIYDRHVDVVRRNEEQQLLSSMENQPEEEEGDSCEPDDEMFPLEWMVLSNMGPNREVDAVELGIRGVDMEHDWNTGYNNFNRNGNVDYLRGFIKQAKKNSEVISPTEANVHNVVLTEEQHQVISLVKQQIELVKNETSHLNAVPKKVIVQGKAGTGKSVLIATISDTIKKEFYPDSLLYLVAPTGVAALNVQGATIHSVFHIPRDIDDFESLKGVEGKEFTNKMKNVKFLIIDEYSMVGCNLLGMMDQRCRQATGKDEDFGGINVYLFGDVNQLPPVNDTPLYTFKPISRPLGVHGKMIFDNFDKCIVLSLIHRQSDEKFKTLLDHISSGEITSTDYKLVEERFEGNVNREHFKDAIELYPTRKLVKKRNMHCLANLKCPMTKKLAPIARIEANHNNPKAAEGSIDNASGLAPVLYLAVGAKVMCKSNLFTSNGLVNGSIGEVKEIVYQKDGKRDNDLPVAIVCSFESYKGPYLNDDPSLKLVPIPTITNSWKSKSGQLCTRTQFPLTLAYAWSIHKSQGLTLDKAVIDIGKLKEMAPGLTYVALSRVRTLDGIMLKRFDKSRFLRINNSQALLQRKKCLEYFNSKTL